MRWLAAAIPLCLALPCAVQAQPAGHPRDVLGALLTSWYDCRTPGQCRRDKRTASGELFNENAHTCAHRRLPFGTRLRVTYRGRSVVCRVNDRGPFVKGRKLDLSRACAWAIGLRGVAVVIVERI